MIKLFQKIRDWRVYDYQGTQGRLFGYCYHPDEVKSV
jgi:hypothetical protein